MPIVRWAIFLSQQPLLKSLGGFDPKRIFHGGHPVLGESRFFRDTQEIAYVAPPGRAIMLRGIVYGKGSKRKNKNSFFFPQRPYPIKR
jgi:hypothetical protein